MNWQIKEIPVPLSNTTRYNLIDGDTGEVITELSDFTKEQRNLIEAAPLLLEALKAYRSASIVHNDTEAELYYLGAAAIAKTEGKGHEQ